MTEHTGLIRYDTACRALAEARSVDEVKDLRDKSDAMRIYAKQAKNKRLEVDAAEIRIRAERRLGEMLREQKETVGLASAGRPKKIGSDEEPIFESSAIPTLADVGIDKKLSMRSQQLAAVPDETFEEMVGEWRERIELENERVTTKLVREGEKYTKDIEPMRDDEIERRDIVLSGRSVVANKSNDHALVAWARDNGYLLEVDRGTIWGNPFRLDDDGTRDEVCDSYGLHYLPYKPSLIGKISATKGKVLACWCYPERCHAEEIIQYAERMGREENYYFGEDRS